MSTAEQQKQLNQGVLFLIDNAGERSPGVPMRAFTDEKIAEHLAKHSYYYQLSGKSGVENRRLVNASYLRTTSVKNLLELGITGEAILAIIQGQGRSAYLDHVRKLHTEKACTLLAQDIITIDEQLKVQARDFTTQLWSVIVPHLRVLSAEAENHGISSGEPEDAWLQVFEPVMLRIIHKLLHHRLRLHGTGCRYSYTWPDINDAYDPVTMQVDAGKATGAAHPQRVLFTVFRGLKVETPDEIDKEVLVAFKAAVKI